MLDAITGRWRHCLITVAALGAVSLGASRSRAQELDGILLSYEAPAGCPEVGDFQRSVQRRSSRIRFVDEGSHDRELSIHLSADGDFTRGELRLIEHDGSVRQRSVRFSSCLEAVEGLALISTVSLDPQALLQPAETPLPADAQPATNAQPVTAARAEPRGPAPDARRTKPAAVGAETAVGFALNAAFHVVPETAVGGALFLDVASRSHTVLAPLLRGSLSHVERRGLSEPGGNASFSSSLVTLSACPLRLGATALVFRPCALGSGGLLRAWSSNTPDPQAQSRQYWSWGGSAILFLKLSQALELTLDSALGVTLVRDQFTLGGARFWQTPALYLSTGLGLRFALQ